MNLPPTVFSQVLAGLDPKELARAAEAQPKGSNLTFRTFEGQQPSPILPAWKNCWTENALAHREEYTAYNQVLGVVQSIKGINGLVTTWQHDRLSQKGQTSLFAFFNEKPGEIHIIPARIHEGKWQEVTAETARWSWFSAMAAMKSVVV